MSNPEALEFPFQIVSIGIARPADPNRSDARPWIL
jgi:hypothetical protein